MHGFQNGLSTPVKVDNWQQLQKFFNKRDLKVPKRLIDETMKVRGILLLSFAHCEKEKKNLYLHANNNFAGCTGRCSDNDGNSVHATDREEVRMSVLYKNSKGEKSNCVTYTAFFFLFPTACQRILSWQAVQGSLSKLEH